MPNFNLVCLNFQECHLLTPLKSSLSGLLSKNINLRKDEIEIHDFYNQDRGQYDAGRIISYYENNEVNEQTILITSVDLFIPIFTFVFGLAKLKGNTAIVSTHRLQSEFYGLPPDNDLLLKRLEKEIIHEFGHLLNLRHCTNYYCVMASSNSADDLDIKSNHYCKSCLNYINNQDN
jgi:archaemetzincin